MIQGHQYCILYYCKNVLLSFLDYQYGSFFRFSTTDDSIKLNMGICGSEEASSYKALKIRKSRCTKEPRVDQKDVRRAINDIFDRFDFNHDDVLDYQ